MTKNENKIRITVLMAIYNCADTLAEALDSLLAQTYQQFKVVLCDDCSTDNTYEVAQKYKERFPEKFILIKNESNSKLPFSLNRCLEYADTEYVARMDGDDISRPQRFEKEINFLDNNPEYAVVSTAMHYFDENGIFKTSTVTEIPTKRNFIGTTPHAHAAAMIRTNVLKSVSGYTVKRWTRRGQDVHLWAKIYHSGNRGYNLSEPLYMMRDDAAAYKRRTVKEAIYSIRRNYEIYKLMDISRLNIYGLIRPLIVAMLPKFIYDKLHKR